MRLQPPLKQQRHPLARPHPHRHTPLKVPHVNLLRAPIHEYILRTDLHDRREEVFGLVDAVHAGGDRQLVQGVVALEVRQVVAEQVQVELLAEAAVGLVLTQA